MQQEHSSKDSFKNCFTNIWVKYTSIFVTKLVTMITMTIVVRNLTPEDFGLYRFVGQFSNLSALFTSFGLNAVALRFIPELHVKKEGVLINSLFRKMLFIRLMGTLILMIGVELFYHHFVKFFNLPDYFGKVFWLVAMIIIIKMFFPLLTTFSFTLYQQEFKRDLTVFAKSILLLFGFWLVFYNGKGIQSIIVVWGVIAGLSLVYVIYETLLKYFSNRKLGTEKVFSSNLVRRYCKYGFFNLLTSTTGFLRDFSISSLVIAHYLGIADVGIFTFGVTLTLLTQQVNPSEILKSIFYPILFKKYAKSGNKIKTLLNGADFLTKLTMLTVFPLLLLLLLLPGEIIAFIFNPKYTESAGIVMILCSCFFIVCLRKRHQMIFQTTERVEFLFIQVFFGLYNLVASMILIQYFGILGVAFATGSSLVISFLYQWGIIKLYLKMQIKFPWRALCKVMVNCTPMVVLVLLFRSWVQDIFSLIVLMFCALMSYGIFCVLNRIFNNRERELINSVLGRKICIF